MLSPKLVARISDFVREEEKPLRAEWIMDDVVDIYLRRSTRYIHSEKRAWEALDLATMDVHSEYQGKGVFGFVVDHLMAVCPYPILYAENVRGFLVPSLLRRGFHINRSMHPVVSPSLFYLRAA